MHAPSTLKEPFNALTHLAGAVAAVAGGTALVVAAAGDPWRTTSFAVYGIASLALFAASTLLHAVRAGPRLGTWLRRADHAAIFVLIAGSYTPITLVTLRGHAAGAAWTLFAVVWALALSGVLFKLLWFRAPRWLSTALYLLLGWMALLAIGPLVRAMPAGGIALLAAGGAFYSVGAVVYALKRPDPAPATIGYHGLWHLLVLAGWGAHFAMMALYVLPA
ncbi:MAG: hemolysin III family protein [Deinococcales bacterium]